MSQLEKFKVTKSFEEQLSFWLVFLQPFTRTFKVFLNSDQQVI